MIGLGVALCGKAARRTVGEAMRHVAALHALDRNDGNGLERLAGEAKWGKCLCLGTSRRDGKCGVRFTVSLSKMDLNPRNHSTQNYP